MTWTILIWHIKHLNMKYGIFNENTARSKICLENEVLKSLRHFTRQTPELPPDPIHSAPVVQSKHRGRSVMLQVTHHSLPVNLDHFITSMNLLRAISRGLQRGKQESCAAAGLPPCHNNPHPATSEVAPAMLFTIDNFHIRWWLEKCKWINLIIYFYAGGTKGEGRRHSPHLLQAKLYLSHGTVSTLLFPPVCTIVLDSNGRGLKRISALKQQPS